MSKHKRFYAEPYPSQSKQVNSARAGRSRGNARRFRTSIRKSNAFLIPPKFQQPKFFHIKGIVRSDMSISWPVRGGLAIQSHQGHYRMRKSSPGCLRVPISSPANAARSPELTWEKRLAAHVAYRVAIPPYGTEPDV